MLLNNYNTLTLLSPQDTWDRFELIDIQGRYIDVFEQNISIGNNPIHLENKSYKGLYILRYSDDLVEICKKIILK